MDQLLLQFDELKQELERQKELKASEQAEK